MGSTIPHRKAVLLVKEKIPFEDGSLIAVRIWQVPESLRTPEGLKYSLVYISPTKKRLLGYDNAEGKGHHRHEGTVEASYPFTTIEELVQRFFSEVEELRKRHEN